MQRFTDVSQSVQPTSGGTTFLTNVPNPPFGQPIDPDSPLYPLPSTFSIRSRTNSNDLLGTLTLHQNGSCSTSTLTAGSSETATEPSGCVWTWTKYFPVSASAASSPSQSAAGGYLALSPAQATDVAVWAIPTLTEDYPSSRFWIRRVWPSPATDDSVKEGVLPATAGMLVRKRN
ncbi:hypothetical protein BCR44DRAFT_1449943 [Catenaria anguillulae PL171]|uniref:Uncharacterized protein n=1 Tax=Catenaria anguillulae PL171 TaxID=765915 RepID=A0A1Y2H4I1_9FUNG|nr:hypothetical protein BCR44DRAFT_1449943 [Catenaria anguillulae PL171]